MLLVLSVDTAGPGVVDSPDRLVSGRLAVATWAIAALTFSAGLRFAAVWFRAPPWGDSGVPVDCGPQRRLDCHCRDVPAAGRVLVPVFVLMGVWQGRARCALLHVARQHRFVGALMAGIGVTAIIAVNTTAAFMVASYGALTQSTINVTYLNFLSVTLVMLGMHLLIFEDVIEELRTSGAALRESRDEMRAVAVTDPHAVL